MRAEVDMLLHGKPHVHAACVACMCIKRGQCSCGDLSGTVGVVLGADVTCAVLMCVRSAGTAVTAPHAWLGVEAASCTSHGIEQVGGAAFSIGVGSASR